LNALEGKDVTQARASVLLKYDPDWGGGKAEKDAVEKSMVYQSLLDAIADDLKTLKNIWMEKLPALSAADQKQLNTLDTYFGKDREDSEYKEAKAAVQKLQKSA